MLPVRASTRSGVLLKVSMEAELRVIEPLDRDSRMSGS